MELDLQQAEALWPQGCCRPSGNTSALASPHRLQQGEEDKRSSPGTRLPPILTPDRRAGHLLLPRGPSWGQEEGRGAGPGPSAQSAGSCLGRPGPAPSRSTPGRPAGPSARGTRVGPPHSSRPPCPHGHCCQLEPKTHPQVAISNRAGSGPSADDRLRALLRPACCAAAGARGLGSSRRPGPPRPPLPFPPQGHIPRLRPQDQGRPQRPARYVGVGLWPQRGVARGQEGGK